MDESNRERLFLETKGAIKNVINIKIKVRERNGKSSLIIR